MWIGVGRVQVINVRSVELAHVAAQISAMVHMRQFAGALIVSRLRHLLQSLFDDDGDD